MSLIAAPMWVVKQWPKLMVYQAGTVLALWFHEQNRIVTEHLYQRPWVLFCNILQINKTSAIGLV